MNGQQIAPKIDMFFYGKEKNCLGSWHPSASALSALGSTNLESEFSEHSLWLLNYGLPLFILPHETALAKPLALFDLQVGDPNPYQLTPADLQRDEVRSSISLRVASERIEPIASLALWKTTREGLLPILECVGTQVWSLHFLGNFAILTPFA